MKAGIAGAGLMGRLLAWKLIQAGWQVTLFDRDNKNGAASCGMSAAGMLAPIAEIENSDADVYNMGLRSLTLWPDIIKKLDHPVYFQQTGSLVVAHPQDNSELQRYSELVSKKLSGEGFETLNPYEIKTLEPELNHFNAGLYFPIEGQINAPELMNALEAILADHQVQWTSQTPVYHVGPHYIRTGKKNIKFDLVFDCRGLGAKSNFPELRGVRGELIELHAPDVNLSRPIRLLHPRYRLYIVPRPNHRYIIGSSEIESEDMSAISVRSTLEFLTAAFSVHTGFAEARMIKQTVNCRPTLPNHLPVIKHEPGLVAINGLYRHGFLLAPALLEQMEQFYA